MLALLFLTGAAVLGACVTRRALRGALDGWEHVLWGTVVGWMLASLLVYVFARWQGRLTYAVVAWATVLVWLAAALMLAPAFVRLRRAGRAAFARSVREFFGRQTLLRSQHVGLAVVLVVFAPVFWRLFSSHTFAGGVGGVYSGGSAWYDLSFHAALATSFLYGNNFPPTYTPLAGEPLLYPFMPDFHAAALMAAGLTLRAAMLATALPLALACVGIFYSFALRVARSTAAATLATFLFLLNGGLGFREFFHDWRRSGLGLAEFWSALSVNYANLWVRGIHWTNLVTDTFVPQRASLYGLPAGLMIFTLFAIVWRSWNCELRTADCGLDEHESNAVSNPSHRQLAINNPQWVLLLVAGVLAGLLPLFHTHTYIAVCLVSLFLFALSPRRAWLAFWTPAALLAAPHLLSLARHAATGGIVRLQPGWMSGDDAAFFPVYLLRNFGLPLLIGGLAWLTAPRAWKSFYLAFVMLFAFSLVVVVSPNLFDNGKLTYYWHALNSVFVARWLVRLAGARRIRLASASLAVLLTLLCVLTGIAALQAESHASTRLFTDEDSAAAQFIREKTAPHALFLTAPTFNQPALCLAGRRTLRGATDWLWAHGYEFREREADVRRIYAGSTDALELLRYYGVDYVYVGEAERRESKADDSFFEANFSVVYRSPGITIYDARTAPLINNDSDKHKGDAVSVVLAPRELAARVGRDPFALLSEFPRTSFFVYRLLKASRGREPRRDEFMSALKVFGRGLYVGAQGWEQQLDANRRTLALQLAEGDDARATALLRAADDGEHDARGYDTAYVLVHFFGYLGRNPGDPPDHDLEGFNFWRDVLHRTGDYRSISRAFLESDEYKKKAVEP
ncbi:MAG: hypothetical protein QOE46_2164 [Acidobacteriota bacterium]|nr:hypothetical protein [Acidobacteriota bacterium]